MKTPTAPTPADQVARLLERLNWWRGEPISAALCPHLESVAAEAIDALAARLAERPEIRGAVADRSASSDSPPADVARDAARFRYLRDNWDYYSGLMWKDPATALPKSIDAALDAAMNTTKGTP